MSYSKSKTDAEFRPYYYFPEINTPGFTFKHLNSLVDISYRKIKDWDNKNIISGTRENEDAGWRKFSLMDFLKLQIIVDLKEFGLKADKVLKIFSEIEKHRVLVYQAESIKDVFQSKQILPPGQSQIDVPTLEHYFTACSNGEKFLLIIDNKLKISFKFESSFNDSPKNFSTPHILLPFFTYVKKIHDFLNEEIDVSEWTNIKSFRESLKLSIAESQVIDLLRNYEFQEIKITRNGSNEIVVRAKTTTRGKLTVDDVIEAISKKNYQTVQISKVNGNIINISREETLKV